MHKSSTALTAENTTVKHPRYNGIDRQTAGQIRWSVLSGLTESAAWYQPTFRLPIIFVTQSRTTPQAQIDIENLTAQPIHSPFVYPVPGLLRCGEIGRDTPSPLFTKDRQDADWGKGGSRLQVRAAVSLPRPYL